MRWMSKKTKKALYQILLQATEHTSTFIVIVILFIWFRTAEWVFGCNPFETMLSRLNSFMMSALLSGNYL